MVTYPQLNNRGRLGNQLFQIASTMGIAKSISHDFTFPEWEYQHCFGNELPTGGEMDVKFSLAENTCDYTPVASNLVDPTEDLSLEGYFQSEKYFLNVEEEVRECFEFSDDILEKIEKKYSKVLEEYDTTIHVRRGDYSNLADVYWNLSHLYYFKAMSVLLVKKAVIFSDDIEWCKNIFRDTDCYFVSEREHDSYQIGYTATAERDAKSFTFEDATELALMSMFKNNIIANSTFSWWAAWLNKNPNKLVIAPSRWYTPERAKLITSPKKADGDYINDIIPKTWTKI